MARHDRSQAFKKRIGMENDRDREWHVDKKRGHAAQNCWSFIERFMFFLSPGLGLLCIYFR